MKGELRPPSAPGIAKPFPDPSVKALQALILWITLQDSQVRLYPHLCCPSIRRYLANYRVTSEITGTLSFPSSMFSLVLKNLGFTHPLTYHIIPFSTCMSGGTQIFHSLTDLDLLIPISGGSEVSFYCPLIYGKAHFPLEFFFLVPCAYPPDVSPRLRKSTCLFSWTEWPTKASKAPLG